MGLLEDLERQAQQRRQQEELNAEELARRREVFKKNIRPTVGRVYEYIRELTNHVNYLQIEKTIDFTVPGYGIVPVQVLPEYQIRVSKNDDQVSLTINSEAEIPLDAAPEVFVESEGLVKEMQDLFVDAGISARQNKRRDTSTKAVASTFQLYGQIKRIAIIRCQAIQDDIQFEFYNFAVPGKQVRRFRPEQIDEKFMDRLGRFLIGEDADFLRDVHDEEDLERIRESIRERKHHAVRERDPEPRSGLLGQLRELWEKPD